MNKSSNFIRIILWDANINILSLIEVFFFFLSSPKKMDWLYVLSAEVLSLEKWLLWAGSRSFQKPKEKSTCWFLLMEKSLLREAGERQLEKDECSGLTVPSLLSFDSLSAVRVLDAAAGGRLKPLEAGGFVRSWRESQELSESWVATTGLSVMLEEHFWLCPGLAALLGQVE